MKKPGFASLLVASILLFAGCAKQASAPDLSPPSFHDKPVIALDVGEVKVINEYEAPQTREHMERLFPTSPAEAVEIWVRDRLRAQGNTSRRLEVVIHEASAVETALPVRKDLKGAFTKEPNRKYDVTLDVTMKVYGSTALLPEAEVQVKVSLSRELLEGANARDQDALFAAMTRDIAKKLDQSLESNINSYFSRYLVQATPQEW